MFGFLGKIVKGVGKVAGIAGKIAGATGLPGISQVGRIADTILSKRGVQSALNVAQAAGVNVQAIKPGVLSGMSRVMPGGSSAGTALPDPRVTTPILQLRANYTQTGQVAMPGVASTSAYRRPGPKRRRRKKSSSYKATSRRRGGRRRAARGRKRDRRGRFT
jgi:hypothetical protein